MLNILRLIFSLRLLLTLAVLYFLFGGPFKNIVFDLAGIEQTTEEREPVHTGIDFLDDTENSGLIHEIKIVLENIKDKVVIFFNDTFGGSRE